MKKVIVAVVGIVAAWLVVSLTMSGAKKTAAASQWPLGLGRLDSVPKRYPSRAANPAALHLDWLAGRQDVDALRTHLLRGGPFVRDFDVNHGIRTDYRRLNGASRLLAADARATGNWDSLRAQWELAKPLWQRPDFVSTMIALAMTRDLVDAAAALPSPPPAWLGEVRTFDYRRAMIAALQVETWRTSRTITEHWKMQGLRAAYWRVARVEYVQLQRRNAWALARGEMPSLRPAWWNRPAYALAPNLDAAWQRLAKLEKDAKALRR